jgi:hypothetical protein
LISKKAVRDIVRRIIRHSAGIMERVKGIEPSYAAWEAAVLPLNYTRMGRILTAERFERQLVLFRQWGQNCGGYLNEWRQMIRGLA